MKTMRRFLLVVTTLFWSSCYYDQEGILYPETANCVPSGSPSYVADVKPIVDTKCNNCHGGSFPSGGVKLDTYSDVLHHANNGSLIGSIKQTGSYSPMPKNGGKLSTCEIQKIQNWLNAGSPNN